MWVVVLRQIPFVRDIVYNRPGLDGARNLQHESTSPGLDGSARAGQQEATSLSSALAREEISSLGAGQEAAPPEGEASLREHPHDE